MRKLLDETTDELTRALLGAGVDHHPPAGNQAKLMLALGVGSSFSLFSSKALAWLGTGVGKVTMVSVTLCALGAIYAAIPEPAKAPEAQAAVRHAHALELPRAEPLRLERGVPEVSAPAPQMRGGEAAALASRAIERVTTKRSGRPAQRIKARPRAAKATVAEASERAGLDSEVRLVDQLRASLQRSDWDTARQLVRSHRAMFPDGQLAQEVTELAAHMAPAATP